MMYMSSQNILNILEEVVYSHSRHLDRCKQLIRKAMRGGTPKLAKGFESLAKESKRLEEILLTLSREGVGSLIVKDLEMLFAIVFYIYEVSVEEERNLWSKYAKLIPGENVEKHYVRLNRMKSLAQKILESSE